MSETTLVPQSIFKTERTFQVSGLTMALAAGSIGMGFGFGATLGRQGALALTRGIVRVATKK